MTILVTTEVADLVEREGKPRFSRSTRWVWVLGVRVGVRAVGLALRWTGSPGQLRAAPCRESEDARHWRALENRSS